ncbi:MAG: hypothetical protein KIT56_01790 [Gammaproteobacteria bacterium]|nr:hypothetical protein [Gammaproteobacteria bacterium]MCW5582616.1 hypothetical protein [Gammaproteobacteria bacterium]
MKIKYYSINEIIKILETKGLNADLENIRSCVRECLIHPLIYIDSFPAYACETQSDGSALAVGLCFLSAYWNPGDEILAAFNSLMKKDVVEIQAWINISALQKNFKMHSWQYNDHVFIQAPPKHVSPKPYSENIKIKFFNLLERNITLKNIMISDDDVHKLVEYLGELNAATNLKKQSSRSSDFSQKERTSLLNLISEMELLHIRKNNTNRSAIISEISGSSKKPGLSKRNLEKIFPEAALSLENS